MDAMIKTPAGLRRVPVKEHLLALAAQRYEPTRRGYARLRSPTRTVESTVLLIGPLPTCPSSVQLTSFGQHLRS